MRHHNIKGQYPAVLIFDRSFDPIRILAHIDTEVRLEGKAPLASQYPYHTHLHWCDSCGTRAVWYWSHSGDYEDAQDLPEGLFTLLEIIVAEMRRQGRTVSICSRREDPGLGIYIPELDDPVLDAGGIPDGCIRPSTTDRDRP